jgi:hypothetical protein
VDFSAPTRVTAVMFETPITDSHILKPGQFWGWKKKVLLVSRKIERWLKRKKGGDCNWRDTNLRANWQKGLLTTAKMGVYFPSIIGMENFGHTQSVKYWILNMYTVYVQNMILFNTFNSCWY